MIEEKILIRILFYLLNSRKIQLFIMEVKTVQFGKIIILPLALMVLVSEMISATPINGTSANQDLPNIIFIMADDLGYSDINSFDPLSRTFYETPNIDRLAEGGMRFLHAYTNGANCAPTRAALISGQYYPNQPIYHVGNSGTGAMIPAENAHELPLEKITHAEMLKKAGYQTALIGKWHLGDPPEFGPQEQGFDINVGGYNAGNPGVWEGGYFEPNNNPFITDSFDGEYLTDYKTRKAIEFITDNKDERFYLNLSLYTPHTPLQAPEHLVEKYKQKSPDRGHYNATYAAMIESMDMNIGKIMETLEALGLEENTIVIFYSDNGGQGGYEYLGREDHNITDNSPLKGGKSTFYEGGLRVPMIVRWPSVVVPGSVSHEPVLSIDFYPTYLEVSGLDQPENYKLDGLSFLPVLKKPDHSLNREALYWHFPGYPNVTWRTTPVSVIRAGEWKLMKFYETNTVELYNVIEDEGEENDLSETMPEKRVELQQKLEKWLEGQNAPLPRWP